MIGMGLLEAIPDEQLQAWAADNGGRVSTVMFNGAQQVGRFGWTAEATSVRHQVTKALFMDMGVGTTVEGFTPPELSQQTIHPYTDLLLHDLGEGEFRTPPLWGLGSSGLVSFGDASQWSLMHDGLSTSLEAAINRPKVLRSRAWRPFNCCQHCSSKSFWSIFGRCSHALAPYSKHRILIKKPSLRLGFWVMGFRCLGEGACVGTAKRHRTRIPPKILHPCCGGGCSGVGFDVILIRLVGCACKWLGTLFAASYCA